MAEAKDSAIKLFGMTIAVPEMASASGSANESHGGDSASASVPSCSGSRSGPASASASAEECADEKLPRPSSSSSPTEDDPTRVEEEPKFEKESLVRVGEVVDTQQDDVASPLASGDVTTSSVAKENHTEKVQLSNNEEEGSETGNSQEKPLKKPDKILPCPRCNSMETKFCYYNNYNVNQPRHFCKNCQRYWTAGGTMRNVPVGAGRRKNKNIVSHYRQITVSEALQNARNGITNGINPSLSSNGTVLAFGSDTPLCESMASVLNLAEKTARTCMQNGFCKPEELTIPISLGSIQNGNDQARGSVVADSNRKVEADKTSVQEQVMQHLNGFNPQMPCVPGAPWPYPWNAAQWNSSVPTPAFYPAGFSMPFYPAAYWGCSVPGAWNNPWGSQPSSPDTPGSSPNSPRLGKHSRDESLLKPNTSGEDVPTTDANSEKCFWIPKTLRIDDPGDAAKSSIWATLGIRNDKPDSPRGRGLFKAYQSKDGEKNDAAETSPMLQINPAALSRSQNFQERS